MRSQALRLPVRSSRSSDQRVAWIPRKRNGSGGNGSGLERTNSVCGRHRPPIVQQVEHHRPAEPRRRDAEAGVAERVRDATVERPAPEHAEAAAGVDRAAPHVGELDVFELGERLEEVPAERRPRRRPALVLGRHLAAPVVDGVVAAPQDPVVRRQAVVVELVGDVRQPLPVPPTDRRRAAPASAARSPCSSRRPARCSAGRGGSAAWRRWSPAPPCPPGPRRAVSSRAPRRRRARATSPWSPRRCARRVTRRRPSTPTPGGPGRRAPPGPCATDRRCRSVSRPGPASARRRAARPTGRADAVARSRRSARRSTTAGGRWSRRRSRRCARSRSRSRSDGSRLRWRRGSRARAVRAARSRRGSGRGRWRRRA